MKSSVKKCKTCGEHKPHTDYYKNNLICKSCYSVNVKAKNYGVTPKKFKEYMETSTVCECCGSPDDLCYDHDHNTGLFRGVLCRNCNSGIGKLGDNIDGVLNALVYLKGRK